MSENTNKPIHFFRKRSYHAPDDFTEMLFADRNKFYGAYKIRRFYQRRLLYSFLFSVMCLFLFCLPLIIGSWGSDTVDLTDKRTIPVDLEAAAPALPVPEPVEPPKEEEVKIKQDLEVKVVNHETDTIEKKDTKPATQEANKTATQDKSADTSPDGKGLGGSDKNGMGAALTKNFDHGPVLKNNSDVYTYIANNYPPALKDRGVMDNIMLVCDVDSLGRVVSCEVVKSKGIKELNDLAIRAAQLGQFDPAVSHEKHFKAKAKWSLRMGFTF